MFYLFYKNFLIINMLCKMCKRKYFEIFLLEKIFFKDKRDFYFDVQVYHKQHWGLETKNRGTELLDTVQRDSLRLFNVQHNCFPSFNSQNCNRFMERKTHILNTHFLLFFDRTTSAEQRSLISLKFDL